MATLKSAVIRH